MKSTFTIWSVDKKSNYTPVGNSFFPPKTELIITIKSWPHKCLEVPFGLEFLYIIVYSTNTQAVNFVFIMVWLTHWR